MLFYNLKLHLSFSVVCMNGIFSELLDYLRQNFGHICLTHRNKLRKAVGSAMNKILQNFGISEEVLPFL